MLSGLVHALGVVAFLYPFWLGADGGRGAAHAGDAPWLFTLFGALLIAIAMSEVRGGRMDAKQLALLGVLAGVNAILRLPGAFGGASLMFVLPIVAGAVFGARFAFMLGATSMAASAVITGGIGPWLPFQMWALGWIGAGAGVTRRLVGERPGPMVVGSLAAYGWIAGLAFGVLVNLWFWPYLDGASDLAWQPGLGIADTLRRYWRFYLVTSLAWDATRAIANAVLIAGLGLPLLRLLVRYRERTRVVWNTEPPSGVSMVP